VIHDSVEIADGELCKESNVKNGEFDYFKYITVDGVRYVLYLQHSAENAEGEVAIHFALANSLGNPVTNAGLEVFGKIATEIEKMYQEVSKEQQISQFKILASKDSHSVLDEQRVRKLSRSDLLGLEGFRFVDTEFGVDVEIRGQMVSVVCDGITRKPVALRPQLIDDLQAISLNIDIELLATELLHYLNRGEKGDKVQSEKETQRLKLYQFYFQKRYPQFTFNSNITIGEDGKRNVEFEKDEEGRPFLLVFTNDKNVETVN
jgi:hypothetical protein